MRVLYLLFHPDANSESYIRTEIEWMQRQGVEIATLATKRHRSVYTNTVANVQYGSAIAPVLASFKPDIVHVHWLYTITWTYQAELAKLRVPVTARGHSFDFSVARAHAIAELPSVRRLWLFPHFAEQCRHPKIQALTSCYEPTIYTPGPLRLPPQVARVIAGVPTKHLEQTLEIARACPELSFKIAMTRALPPDDTYPEQIRRAAPPNVEVLIDLSREQAAALLRESAVYLVNAPEHKFGMPTSIGEALASGLFVLAPNVPGARDYIGFGGRLYSTADEAAANLKEMAKWPQSEWTAARATAIAQAVKFRTDHVLPTILETWLSLTAATP